MTLVSEDTHEDEADEEDEEDLLDPGIRNTQYLIPTLFITALEVILLLSYY